MEVRGVRGAITVEADDPDQILSATQELLALTLARNPGLVPEKMASVIFTMTADLCSAFPARAARQLGWMTVPLICMQEIPVPDSLPRCIRVLIHWNTDTPQSAINHVYLREAQSLRPDLFIE